jgi:hypothetical protein
MLVKDLGKMVIYRGNPGKEAFIGADTVEFFPGELGSFGKGIRSLKIIIPGKPGKVKSPRFWPHRGEIISL